MKRVVTLIFQLGLASLTSGTVVLSQDEPKPRVFVIQSDTWSLPRTFPGDGLIPDFLLGSRGGGSPQTAEIMKTFGERCKESIVNISREKADYIILLEHEGGKGLLRVDNKFAIFDPDGDAIESGSTRSLGNSVDDACTAMKKDWKDRDNGRKPHVKRPAPEVAATPKPVTTLDRREAGGTESTSAVTFQSEPDGAEIEIDGKLVGNTPSLLQLKVGDHTVTVTRKGYRPWQKTFSVIPGGNILFRADLEKEPSVVVTVPSAPATFPIQPTTSSVPIVPIESKKPSSIELVWIPGGSFQMGSTDGEKYERPVRRVVISEGFWMGKYEVTQLQWFTEMGVNPSDFEKCGGACPVENVSWEDAQRFVARLNARNDGFVYSLPTEAQWEYAARGGTTGKWAGDVKEMAWYSDNSNGRTQSVGTKRANAFGLYDMHGNVWEWCADWYGDYPKTPETDPRGPAKGKYRILRGGSWKDGSGDARSAYRGGLSPKTKYKDIGFRVVARAK